MVKRSDGWKIVVGLAISAVFMFLALRRVNYQQMWHAFGQVNYWYMLPMTAALFLSHWLRAWRWQWLLAPVKRIGTPSLFSALLIGYMANTFLPAHLGEVLRAYVIGHKQRLSASAAFASIVVERIIDVFALLLLMAFTFMLFPFPTWVKKSGIVFFAIAVVAFIVLVLMKRFRVTAMALLQRVLRLLPESWRAPIYHGCDAFLDGIVPLARPAHYAIVTVLSLLIWLCYAVIFHIGFTSFALSASMPWYAALVLVVITTISVVVPSSPGYVGTYHYLCQLSLGFFHIPAGVALTYAFVLHAVTFFPVLIAGLVIMAFGGMRVHDMRAEAAKMMKQ